MNRLVSYLVAGIPMITIFALVSSAAGYLLGSLSYAFAIVVCGELFNRYLLREESKSQK